MAIGTDVLKHQSTYIADSALLGASDVAVAHERELLAFYLNDAMKHEMPGGYLCQDGIANSKCGPRRQLHAVAEVLKERSHGITLDGYYHLLALRHILSDQRQQLIVGQFDTLNAFSRGIGITARLGSSPWSGQNTCTFPDELLHHSIFNMYRLEAHSGRLLVGAAAKPKDRHCGEEM